MEIEPLTPAPPKSDTKDTDVSADDRPAAQPHRQPSPSREAARADVLRFFIETGRSYRVAEAGWTHTRYDIVAHPEDKALLGRAVIDEVCACEHTHLEHDDVGCTVTVIERGRPAECECRGYEPVPGDPMLFGVGSCVSAAPPGPT
jgi:hypothetical protein